MSKIRSGKSNPKMMYGSGHNNGNGNGNGRDDCYSDSDCGGHDICYNGTCWHNYTGWCANPPCWWTPNQGCGMCAPHHCGKTHPAGCSCDATCTTNCCPGFTYMECCTDIDEIWPPAGGYGADGAYDTSEDSPFSDGTGGSCSMWMWKLDPSPHMDNYEVIPVELPCCPEPYGPSHSGTISEHCGCHLGHTVYCGQSHWQAANGYQCSYGYQNDGPDGVGEWSTTCDTLGPGGGNWDASPGGWHDGQLHYGVIPGDLNNDGVVNVVDIVALVYYLSTGELQFYASYEMFMAMDIHDDGVLNVSNDTRTRSSYNEKFK
jgi:hypothetical protein